MIIDDDLTFHEHAMEKLNQCNQTWGLIKHTTSRNRGLNTRSLTYLFKTVVVTKILYAGVVWLYPNLDKFTSLWNKTILKISGAIVNPHHEITEIALQLPPLEIQLEIFAVKFLCKCLTSNDIMTNIIYQIDGSLGSDLHFQIKSLKDFMTWKLQKRNRREIELLDEQVSTAANYSQSDMEKYTKEIWMKRTYNRCLMRNRLSCHDNTICEAIKNKSIDISKSSYLFRNGSSRYMDTRVMDFVQGSSDRFQGFMNSAYNSPYLMCNYCNSDWDSPEHQLLYCEKLDDPTRLKLLEIFQEPFNIAQSIIFEGNAYLYDLLYKRVLFIDSVQLDI